VKIKRLFHFVILITFVLKVSGSLGYFEQKSVPFNKDIFKTNILIKSLPIPGSQKHATFYCEQFSFENQEDDNDHEDKSFILLDTSLFELFQNVKHSSDRLYECGFTTSTIPLFIYFKRLII
jgi:hypothetical protein